MNLVNPETLCKFPEISAAYTTSTWNKLNSAKNCFKNYESDTKSCKSWPLTATSVNEFAHWALKNKNLKTSTVESYLGSLSTLHKLNGLDASGFNNFICKTILRGAENLEVYEKSTSKPRYVMTLETLKILGHQIALLEWSEISKQIIWTTCCIAFFGSCRIGELLSHSEKHFDPFTTLLWKDMRKNGEGWLIHIKSPKSRTVGGEYIDIFSFPGHNCCPVKALNKLEKLYALNCNKGDPVFKFENGILLTKPLFNKIVRSLLSEKLGKKGTDFSGHSFRAGIPAALAKHPKLVSDNHIMGWGRWGAPPSYLAYTRLRLDQKKDIFEKIRNVLNC